MTSVKTPVIAIVGRANVGKSSLFNAFLGKREAIVAREAGTTRDSITAKLTFSGQEVWLVDTAGLKDAEDEFEASIQDQIAQAVELADMIFVVLEADQDLNAEDRSIAKTALKSKKPVVLLANKADHKHSTTVEYFKKTGVKDIYFTSATTLAGIDEVFQHISENLPLIKIKRTDDRIKVALLGRPNAGKSALFNALSKKQQALVSERAGTTRDVNRQVIKYHGQEIELMDTAGIRRKGKIEVGIEKFSVLRSLVAIEEADICLLLTDANEVGVVTDQRIAGLVKDAGKGLIIVVSKWDAVENKDAFLRDEIAARIQSNFNFTPWAPLIFTSSVSGQNVTKLFDLFMDISEARSQKVKTSLLNRWLRNVTAAHPPAGLKNSHPKLNYVTQTDDSTPTFRFFGSSLGLLHWSYKRHMDREMRRAFGFEGTAIQFYFTNKVDRHDLE